ncbi:MAG: bifunctional diaminohydroxyphosphoribosylaminopyrimidine deaminase/5-amino-6-(5-phosphoribosylamino)uracil reductase RibD [Pirellulales bacterium]|nr:bifunctional diaminohydroxyphosphoribosylaminopyrimidine deaminase/5-amino-6-(5-phosphoribosylamino)uracil reductase RibD [Pirellulales bacterium]
MNFTEEDTLWMARAVELAARGEGYVEPNPQVGCLIVKNGQVVAEGWHQQYGGPHAEVHALRLAGESARGSTVYVTLEPCCHYGKTPPCTEALIAAGVSRVVFASGDPHPAVNGGGRQALVTAGIAVEAGLLERDANRLNAPYFKRLATGLPWVIAKWAMTLDGKIAASTGHSQWITGEPARQAVHRLRGRMDAILVGGGTARRDDPLLTARPPGPRRALRVILDSKAQLASESQLLTTAREVPLLVVVGPDAKERELRRLQAAGAEIFTTAAGNPTEHWGEILAELGRRNVTNLLVEGGSRVLGSLHDAGRIDEVWAFIAPKLVGGFLAPTPFAGHGLEQIPAKTAFSEHQWRVLGEDLWFTGRLQKA